MTATVAKQKTVLSNTISGSSRLDSNTKSVRKKTQFRSLLFKMRKISGSFICTDGDFKRGYNRTRYCGCAVKNDDVDKLPINIVQDKKGNVYYQGLVKCGSIWRCPVCNYKITQQRQLEVYDYCKSWFKEDKKNKISFITLTLHHTKTMTLKRSLDLLTAEYRKMQRCKGYEKLKKEHGIIGFIKSLEITYNDVNGWHPHLHLLFFHKSNEINGFHDKVTDQWLKRESIKGSKKGQKAIEVYGNKGISEYITKWDLAKEMTKGSFKLGKGESITPFEMLKMVTEGCADKIKITALYKQYCTATYRKHKIHISKGIKEAIPQVTVMTDEEILEQQTAEKILLKIDQELWKIIVEKELEAEILNICQYREWKHLHTLLYEHRMPYHFSASKKLLMLKSKHHGEKFKNHSN